MVRISANWKSSYFRFRTVTQVFNQDQSATNFYNTFQWIIDAIILRWNASYTSPIHYFALKIYKLSTTCIYYLYFAKEFKFINKTFFSAVIDFMPIPHPPPLPFFKFYFSRNCIDTYVRNTYLNPFIYFTSKLFRTCNEG